ncbi:MAG: DNA alkylation repair protein [Saprospiraceae bacterium]|nr:DNA alkylation repair protein [Saprospiraceae bacterium]
MAINQKKLHHCKQGHSYYKSSNCLTCPACEKLKKPKFGFLSGLAAPARRALEQNNITTLKKLANYSESELLNLHGIGKTCMKSLKNALAASDLSFKVKTATINLEDPVEPDSKLKLTARQFIEDLKALQLDSKSDNSKFYKGHIAANKFLGVRMLNIFNLAKEYKLMPLGEIEKLLDSDYYEVRMGAVSIMDFQARDSKLGKERLFELYSLYLRKHDRIDNWDLVDRSAPYVIGGYLFDKARAPLYKLAKSKQVNERRTAIVSTYFFIRQNDLEDTFKIADMLVNDSNELINKAVGSWIREAGKRNQKLLLVFLDKHASTMPRVSLRYALEKLNPELKAHYMSMVN